MAQVLLSDLLRIAAIGVCDGIGLEKLDKNEVGEEWARDSRGAGNESSSIVFSRSRKNGRIKL